MIEYAVFSSAGEKNANEDAVKIVTNHALGTYGFLLADGLGGHGKGDIASRFVVDCAGAVIENAADVSDVLLDECFSTAQEMLMDEKEISGLRAMKSTLVILLVIKDTARWGHIGDSRLYHFRDGKVYRRTADHSVPQMLAESHQIKEREIRHHPDRSVLLRAMGAEWDSAAYEVDERGMSIKKGDAFLLCSDGLWEWIEEKAMIRILKKGLPAYDSIQELAQEAIANGQGHDLDNVSGILILIK